MWNNEKYYDGVKVWITPAGLQELGVSAEYIRKATSHARKHNLESWKSVQNPFEGVRVLIDYASIPELTRQDKDLPTVESLLKSFESSAEDTAQVQLAHAIDQAVAYNWDKYMIYYPDEEMAERKQLAQACAVLALALDWGKGDYGIAKKADFYRLLGMELDRIQLKYIRTSHPDRVSRWVSKARKQGITATVQRPNKGNSHRLKVTAWHQWIITAYYAHPQKYTAPMIHSLLKYQCQLYDKELVSSSTVTHYVSRREVQALAAPTREGDKAFRDFYRPYISRKGVMFASDLWVMDGTRANFAYKNDRGQIAFLDVYMVMDAHSWCILGFAVAENEDRWVILDAMKMAISLSAHLPAEMLFDNHSAKSTEEMSDALGAIEQLGTQVRYAKVGNAKDKHIERGFEAWQNLAARWYPNFVGEGVKSRRRNARPAPEWIAAQRKNLPDRTGCMQQIMDAIGIYNETETDGGKKGVGSPRKRFNRSERPNVYAIRPEQAADIFWASTVVKMRNATIRIQVRKVAYEFLCTDYEVWKRYDCNTSDRQIQVRVRYDEKDMSSVYLFDAKTNQFLAEAKQKVQVAGDLANMTEQDRKQIMGQEARAKAWEERLKKEMANLKEKAEQEIAPDAELALVTDVAKVKKGELSTAENDLMRRYFGDQESIPAEVVNQDGEPWTPPTPAKRSKTNGAYYVPATLDTVE